MDKLTTPRNIIIGSLIKSGKGEDSIIWDGMIKRNIRIGESSFRDIVLGDGFGSVISCGWKSSEVINECEIENITENGRNGKRRESVSIYSGMSDCLICDGVEGIYGEVVSGISVETVSLFLCRNNTFVECYRSKVGGYVGYVEKNEDYSNQNYTSQQSLSNTSASVKNTCKFCME